MCPPSKGPSVTVCARATDPTTTTTAGVRRRGATQVSSDTVHAASLTRTCTLPPRQASFVGKRTQRYTGQEAVRAVVGPGSLPNPTTAHNPDNLRDKEWSTNYFKGYIDDVRIYPAPLDRNTIAAAMSGQ